MRTHCPACLGRIGAPSGAIGRPLGCLRPHCWRRILTLRASSPASQLPRYRPTPPTPEQQARQEIDAQLTAAGWAVQDYKDIHLSAGLGIAVREYPLEWEEKGEPKRGFADYLL